MKTLVTLLVIFAFLYEGMTTAQNTNCIDSQLICTGPVYTYPAGTTGDAESGPYYSCLLVQPAPAWFHMCFETPGSVTIYMYSNPLLDIDFICWGPFGDPFSPCLEGLTANKVIDCSYSPNPTEYCEIPDGQTGQFYILLITNYSQQPGDITFEQTSGSGSLACDVIYSPVADFSASPLDGQTPLIVQFTDESTNSPTIWNWDFQNDGIFDAFVQNPSFTYYEPGNYSVRLVVENAIAADTMIKENYINAALKPGICIVSVTPEDHNELIWDYQTTTLIDSYNIYRETTQSNEFELIESVPFGDPGIYIDTTSFPQQRPYRYRMTAILTDSSETDSSASHKTIHLAINQGPAGRELNWNPYEGFSFNTYYIYRGSSPDSLSLLDSISSSFNTFTDIDPPLGPLYYAVGLVKEEGCFPIRDDDYSRSVSNIQFNGATGIIDIRDAAFLIFPNPVGNILNIQLEPMKDYTGSELSIFDLQGMAIMSIPLNSAKTSVDIKDIKPGIYFARIKCREMLPVQKLVIF